ncbi:MAG: hypothetical protein QF405_03935 [Roseibacillus sp.]|jgi:hypothetical protein|nr:hypothetical protein [Roseibacillus sp.]
MTRSGKMRLAASLVTVVWICLEIWAVGPVMRESDQASLLEGAVQLAVGDQALSGNDSYNYDKQYFSYWVTTAWLKLRSPSADDSMAIVREGNLLAVTLFALALLSVVGSQRRWSGVQVAVLYGALFTPVLAFSGMFLSPNMISASFLLVLVVMLRPPPERGGDGEGAAQPSVVRVFLVGLLAWAATAARQDALLLMPLLALFTVREDSLGALLHDRRVQAMLMGTVFAIVLGLLLSDGFAVLPAPFFVLPTFVAFIGGGLGALLLLLLVFAATLAGGRSLHRCLVAAAVLLPLIFYGCVLYTPRHLFLPALAILLTIFFERGREVWSAIGRRRPGQLVIVLTLLATMGPWIVGVRMADWRQGAPVTSPATLFPSTDGFWPMGGYGWFFGRLADGAEEAVDHNQRVWAAWSTVNPASLPRGKGVILSSGLVSYGTFHLVLFGKDQVRRIEEVEQLNKRHLEYFVLFDERTLGKRQRGVNATEGSNRNSLLSLLERGRLQVVGEAHGERILLWTPGKPEAGPRNTGVSVKLALHKYFRGNDFRLAPWSKETWNTDELQGHRGVIAGRDREPLEQLERSMRQAGGLVKLESPYDQEPWWGLPVTAEKWEELRTERGDDREGFWVGFGTLPGFMDVRKYAGSGAGR